MNFYAHTHPDFPNSKDAEKHWEPLFTPFGDDVSDCQRENCEKCQDLSPTHGHLNKVAFWTAKFAAEMFTKDSPESKSAHAWGYLTGLWHDFGKFSEAFQQRLKGSPLPVDHSTAGARHCLAIPHFGPLISYLIAGHHAGLADGNELFFGDRSKKEIPDWLSHAQASGIPLDLPLPPPPLTRPLAGNDAMAFMLRFFFSCLVDADFLATEAFMNQSQAQLRTDWPEDIIFKMLPILENHLTTKSENSAATPVNQARETVRQACFAAAEKFRVIDSAAHPVLIPWGEKGQALGEELRKLAKYGRSPNRSHYRRAQQFTVQVYEHEWLTLKPSLTLLFDEAIAILTHPENDYDSRTGLKRPGAACDPNAFCL